MSAWDNRRAEQSRAGQKKLDGQSEASPRPAGYRNDLGSKRGYETRRGETRCIKPSWVDEKFSPATQLGDGRSPSGTAPIVHTVVVGVRACRFQKERSRERKKKARRIYLGSSSPRRPSHPLSRTEQKERFIMGAPSHLTQLFGEPFRSASRRVTSQVGKVIEEVL